MTSIKTAISIEESLYEEVNALANEMKIPRSKLFAIAMAEFLRHKKHRQLLESINEAYADDLDESEQIMLEAMRHHQGKLQAKEW
ncbi:ribbon-helix-helix domain-containing protein [Dolichospermum sp. ST_con]|nr:ribbon-helix-helix domain-containing protein [Dolichospermum sp. ST_con]MDD1418976.1 ribbon-helix-helix domain-containing protein [Dolichospermum sp. ST_sed1]MDD1423312.1 ribbon-helix-helix domain-containing protein [Dolichospermum sp. ST_sed9]MDD1431231.1 ribbon-helix-helix domain-containing protein [Dolichospermum sp. ST_sed6]MDD1435349.1 ribbon-helix-helix domain-containing protein [Dolichospermum sp. ST_sed10]MDD1441299.1 ribbon-helix-helix domain-containing protein [Dolichospermum sp. 